jgi:hypothetical protein
LRRSLLAGAFVALGILVTRHLPDPHAQVVVSNFVFRPHPSHQPRNFQGRWRTFACFSVKGQVFFYPRFIGRIEDCGLREMALALCTFGPQQVPAARMATQHFSGRRYLEAFCHSLFSFPSRYRFWHREPGIYTHESSSQQETAEAEGEAGRFARSRNVQTPGQAGTLCLLRTEIQTCSGIIPKPALLRAQCARPGFAPSFRVRGV